MPREAIVLAQVHPLGCASMPPIPPLRLASTVALSTICACLVPCRDRPSLQVQQLLATCGEHIEAEEGAAWKTLHQSGACPAAQRLRRALWQCAMEGVASLPHLLPSAASKILRLACCWATCLGLLNFLPAPQHSSLLIARPALGARGRVVQSRFWAWACWP